MASSGCATSQGDRTPSPRPPVEPDGMTTIDLSPSRCETPPKEVVKRRYSNGRLINMLIICPLLITLGFVGIRLAKKVYTRDIYVTSHGAEDKNLQDAIDYITKFDLEHSTPNENYKYDFNTENGQLDFTSILQQLKLQALKIKKRAAREVTSGSSLNEEAAPSTQVNNISDAVLLQSTTLISRALTTSHPASTKQHMTTSTRDNVVISGTSDPGKELEPTYQEINSGGDMEAAASELSPIVRATSTEPFRKRDGSNSDNKENYVENGEGLSIAQTVTALYRNRNVAATSSTQLTPFPDQNNLSEKPEISNQESTNVPFTGNKTENITIAPSQKSSRIDHNITLGNDPMHGTNTAKAYATEEGKYLESDIKPFNLHGSVTTASSSKDTSMNNGDLYDSNSSYIYNDFDDSVLGYRSNPEVSQDLKTTKSSNLARETSTDDRHTETSDMQNNPSVSTSTTSNSEYIPINTNVDYYYPRSDYRSDPSEKGTETNLGKINPNVSTITSDNHELETTYSSTVATERGTDDGRTKTSYTPNNDGVSTSATSSSEGVPINNDLSDDSGLDYRINPEVSQDLKTTKSINFARETSTDDRHTETSDMQNNPSVSTSTTSNSEYIPISTNVDSYYPRSDYRSDPSEKGTETNLGKINPNVSTITSDNHELETTYSSTVATERSTDDGRTKTSYTPNSDGVSTSTTSSSEGVPINNDLSDDSGLDYRINPEVSQDLKTTKSINLARETSTYDRHTETSDMQNNPSVSTSTTSNSEYIPISTNVDSYYPRSDYRSDPSEKGTETNLGKINPNVSTITSDNHELETTYSSTVATERSTDDGRTKTSYTPNNDGVSTSTTSSSEYIPINTNVDSYYPISDYRSDSSDKGTETNLGKINPYVSTIRNDNHELETTYSSTVATEKSTDNRRTKASYTPNNDGVSTSTTSSSEGVPINNDLSDDSGLGYRINPEVSQDLKTTNSSNLATETSTDDRHTEASDTYSTTISSERADINGVQNNAGTKDVDYSVGQTLPKEQDINTDAHADIPRDHKLGSTTETDPNKNGILGLSNPNNFSEKAATDIGSTDDGNRFSTNGMTTNIVYDRSNHLLDQKMSNHITATTEEYGITNKVLGKISLKLDNTVSNEEQEFSKFITTESISNGENIGKTNGVNVYDESILTVTPLFHYLPDENDGSVKSTAYTQNIENATVSIPLDQEALETKKKQILSVTDDIGNVTSNASVQYNKGINETTSYGVERRLQYKVIRPEIKATPKPSDTTGQQTSNSRKFNAHEDAKSSKSTLINSCYTHQGPPIYPNQYLLQLPNEQLNKLAAVPPSRQQSNNAFSPNPPVYGLSPSPFSWFPAPQPMFVPAQAMFGPPQGMIAPPQPMAPFGMQPAYMPYPYQPPFEYGPLEAMDKKGQAYICKPITLPPDSLSSIPDSEIRKTFGIQDLSTKPESPRISDGPFLSCPMGEKSCRDGSRCIKPRHYCDGNVDCNDASDEEGCTCKQRIGSSRSCDGYFDCPDGEDEDECFGCSSNEFSCNNWNTVYKRATCIPLKQRCDGIEQCPLGTDEKDCLILADSVGVENQNKNRVSTAIGFLHRLYKGKWYPTCIGSEIWAKEVCTTEAGPSIASIPPKTGQALAPNKYTGKYINLENNNEFKLSDVCVLGNHATFVQCPALMCGLRMQFRNPYRTEEVDTSAEVVEDLLTSKAREAHLGGSRIVGGIPSQPSAWPWIVAIYRNGLFHCSGVIIDEWWILTAGHCTDKYRFFYFEVQAGLLRRHSYAPSEQDRWITKVIPHPDYDKKSLQHDIALVKLSHPLRYNRYIRPICLPTEMTAGSQYQNAPSAGTQCTVVGWGATAEHAPDPDHLREVEVPVMSKCKSPEDNDNSVICAGYRDGGKDACQGDSGGPFMCPNPKNPEQWYLAGIVSHGEGCARPNEPGVYSRVSAYMEWILSNMRNDVEQTHSPLKECPTYRCQGTGRCLSKKRRCNRIVDCLLGDDEIGCENEGMNEVFQYILGAPQPKGRNNDVEVYNFTGKNRRTETKFVCSKLLQVIPARRRCDKVVDCEDGTDESSCTCRDYLINFHPDAICDGTVDCKDLTDELDCPQCKSSHYRCRLSQTCIPLHKRCDGVSDCNYDEDEWDCFALSDGRHMRFDVNGRPELRSNGIFTINNRGTWAPACTNTTETQDHAIVAAFLCDYMGYNDYEKYKIRNLTDFINIPAITQSNNERYTHININTQAHDDCSVMYLRCANSAAHTKQHMYKHEIQEELYMTPWNAAIFLDGRYKCTGVLFNDSWILTSTRCFNETINLKRQFITALIGNVKLPRDIEGPHEQIVPITNYLHVPDTNITLLKLQTDVHPTRYIYSLNFPSRKSHTQEVCLAIGVDRDKNRKMVFLTTSHSNCGSYQKCMRRLGRSKYVCKASRDKNPWAGIIVCDAGNGWYPAAEFYEEKGECGFNGNLTFLSVHNYKRKITNLTAQNIEPNPPPRCYGLRCNLGQCIRTAKICDGIPDCRGAEDELDCERNRTCHLADNCVCLPSEMRCKSGECVPKNEFCNMQTRCADGSDEPARCSCRAYLELTNPGKVCDGNVHCKDKSDEKYCPCKAGNYKCPSSTRCISNALVCDGRKDCPKGEDEEECMKMAPSNSESKNVGKVMVRTAGVWHPGCFPKYVKKSELEGICRKLYFTGSTAEQLKSNATGLSPVFARFTSVLISRRNSSVIRMNLRYGDSPFMSLKENPKCHVLIIKCQ